MEYTYKMMKHDSQRALAEYRTRNAQSIMLRAWRRIKAAIGLWTLLLAFIATPVTASFA